MFDRLEKINARPRPFEFYTIEELWNDEHTSSRMLEYHLNGEIDVSSRRAGFMDRSADWMVDRFNIGPGFKVADFGCGPGLNSIRLAGRAADVTGIDISTRSIRYARESAENAGLAIGYVNQNYLDFETDHRFDLIIMIMCDFCALSPDRRKMLLAKFHGLLKPGGSVLLDVYSLAAFEAREEATLYEEGLLDGFWSPEKYYGFQNTFKYEEEKVVLDKYTIIEASRSRTIYNWLQYFSDKSLEREFRENGFDVESVYGDVAGTPFDPDGPEFAVVARKK